MATITTLTEASTADLSSFRYITNPSLFESRINRSKRRLYFYEGKASFSIGSMQIARTGSLTAINGVFNTDKLNSTIELLKYVSRLNMTHGDHAYQQKTIGPVKE
ncbi:hypothetical protein DITRI_Ditri07aG0166100 [Diplodiscus trichospermus]